MTQWIKCYKMSAKVKGLSFGMTNIHENRSSTYGFMFALGSATIGWSSKQ